MLLLQFSEAWPSLVLRDAGSADEIKLAFAHSGVNVDVLSLDVERAMRRMHKPRPALPANVQEDEEGTGKIVLEEVGGVEIGPADGIKGNVELSG